MVVAEIISVVVEVVATAVATSPTEDVVETIMLLTLLMLRRAFPALLKDVVLWDAVLLKVLQVVVVDKVVVFLTQSKQIQGTHFGTPLTLLLDSGFTTTWINKRCLPKGIEGYTVDKVTGSTLAGTFASTEQVCLEDFSLPDFHPKWTLPKLKACVFHAEC